MPLVIREIEQGSADYQLEVDLRSKILREPLGLRFTPEELALETNDLHLGGFVDARLVGCLILVPIAPRVMKLRQMAVDSSVQGQGVGTKLIRFAEDRARQLGVAEVELNARETAVRFYEGLGYKVCSDTFVEVSLPHRKMKKKL